MGRILLHPLAILVCFLLLSLLYMGVQFWAGWVDETSFALTVAGAGLFLVLGLLLQRLGQGSEQSYLNALHDHYKTFSEKKFIDLKGVPESERRKYEQEYYVLRSGTDEPIDNARGKIPLLEMVASAWLRDNGNPKLLILGEVGVGKTTALDTLRRHFSETARATLKPSKHSAARLRFPVLGGNMLKLPVLVRASAAPFARENKTSGFPSFLHSPLRKIVGKVSAPVGPEGEADGLDLYEDAYVCAHLANRLERYLVDGKLMLLFDIANGGPGNRHVLNQLKKVSELAIKDPKNGFICICWSRNYDDLIKESPVFAGFEKWMIVRLTKEDVQAHLLKALGPEVGAKVFERIARGHVVNATLNPAVLQMLIANYEKASKQDKKALEEELDSGKVIRDFVNDIFERDKELIGQKSEIERTLGKLSQKLTDESRLYLDIREVLGSLPKDILELAYTRTPILRAFDADQVKIGFTNTALQEYYFARFLEYAIRDGVEVDRYFSPPPKWWRYFVLALNSSSQSAEIVTYLKKREALDSMLLAVVCATAANYSTDDESIRAGLIRFMAAEKVGDRIEAIETMFNLLREQDKVDYVLKNYFFPLLADEHFEIRNMTANLLSFIPPWGYPVLMRLLADSRYDSTERVGVARALSLMRKRNLGAGPVLRESDPWHTFIEHGDSLDVVYPLRHILETHQNEDEGKDALAILGQVARAGTGVAKSVRRELEVALSKSEGECAKRIIETLATLKDTE